MKRAIREMSAAISSKDYLVVIETLMAIASLPSRINKLNKTWAATEDEALRSHVGTVIGYLENAWRSSGGSSKAVSIRIDLEPYKPVIRYCRACIDTGKPQWQLLAEKNGWLPPKT